MLKKPFDYPNITPDTGKTQISDHAIYALRITKIHQDAIALFSQLNDDDTYQYELRHKEIIDKYGRYPHRNEILGRTSTPEELAFYNNPAPHSKEKMHI